jgi:hypothetical protein
VVKILPRKGKVWTSNPSTTKIKKKKRKRMLLDVNYA